MLTKVFSPIVFAPFLLMPLAEAETATQTISTTDSAETKKAENQWESEKRQAALKVQLFLDREGFGPGKIDGRWGGFTEKAAKRWNKANKAEKVGIVDGGELDLKAVQDLSFTEELITTYEVTKEDEELVGQLPDDPEAKAELSELPYTSLAEVVAEKFHVDQDFLMEINGLEEASEIKVGSKLRVPNVAEPFDISEPKKLAEESKSEEKTDTAPIELTVLRSERVVEVRKDDELIHSFPISPGANDNQSPAGDWEVSVISWMPEFRWDKSMLKTGERSDQSYMLPPGPNNPVGIVWIGITADGIGLHGTPYPDAIGRNRSHGCIRLSNWDALKLGKAVSTGAKVTIK